MSYCLEYIIFDIHIEMYELDGVQFRTIKVGFWPEAC